MFAPPLAVAIADDVLVALTGPAPHRKHLRFVDAKSGQPRGAIPVAPNTHPVLAGAGHAVVFAIGRTVWIVDARTQRARVVAEARGTPIGLSVVRRRLAWAENVRGRGYVRALTLR